MADDQTEIWKAVNQIQIAMLTTEADGRLVSRPMASIARPEEGRIYFITRTNAKVDEIREGAAVNLAYSDPGRNTFLSISGTARTSQDREKLRELWSLFAEAWMPQGPDAEDVALISVDPDDAKLWDGASSNLAYAGKLLKAVATQTPPKGATVKKVSV